MNCIGALIDLKIQTSYVLDDVQRATWYVKRSGVSSMNVSAYEERHDFLQHADLNCS